MYSSDLVNFRVTEVGNPCNIQVKISDYKAIDGVVFIVRTIS